MTTIPDFRGPVLSPGDTGYDDARAIWNGAIDVQPEVIARCTDTSDVVAAVRWAGERDIAVTVRAGGHGVAGNALCAGLVIDVSQMKGVDVDPATRVVRVRPGVLLGELDAATQAHELVVPAGIVSHTGVAGLTLGGGIGYLMRAHGLTCDHLLGAEIVTAGGDVVSVDDESDPDLMWGLRGGGAGFGVATSFTFRSLPFGPSVFAGSLIFPAEDAHALLTAYRDWAHAAPREITTILNMRWTPPASWIPESLHGRPAVIVSCMFAGSAEDGEAAVKSLRDIGTPLADLTEPMPFVRHQQMYDASVPHGLGYYWKSPYVRDLDANAIGVLADQAWDAKSHKSYTIIPHMGGAIGDVAPDATAFEDRTALFAPNINAVWDDARSSHDDIEWVRRMYRDLAPSSTGKGYVNFQSEIDPTAVYGDAKRDRLEALKVAHDPSGLFRRNKDATRA